MDDSLAVAGLFLVACMFVGGVLGVIDNYFHRRKIRDASRNKS